MEIIRAYRAACARVIANYDGCIARFVGDGVLAYFGYPRAHEDDAERAVRAGLDMIAAITPLETLAERVEVRIAIATGLVVVGDLISGSASEPQAMVGDTPNIAARLQSIAEPGAVIVAASTRELLGDLFAFRSLGFRQVKGISEPDRGVGGRRRSDLGEPLRGGSHDALGGLCRPQGRDRIRALAPAAGVAEPGPGGVDFRRGGDRKIASGRHALREPRVGPTLPGAVSVFALSYQQCAPSLYRSARARRRHRVARQHQSKSSTNSRQCSHSERRR